MFLASLYTEPVDNDVTEVPFSVTHTLMQAHVLLRLGCASHPRVTWVREGNVLENSSKYQLNHGTLVIKNPGTRTQRF